MKTVPAELQACGTLVFGVRIVRADGAVIAWTQHDRDQTVTIDGASTLLAANPGVVVTNFVSAAGLAVDNAVITVIAGDDLTRADILAGKWDGARVYIFRYNWNLPSAGILPVKRGSFGNFTPQQGQFKVEFRDLRQALQRDTTWVIQEACRWRLGDARCGVALAPLTVAAAVTAVANGYEFTASSLVQAADWFAEGSLTWLTGDNAGTPARKVKAFAAGVVTLSEVSTFPIVAGDTFEIIAGCRKRWDVDCKGKFDNILNFGGEKDKPTRDALAALPDGESA